MHVPKVYIILICAANTIQSGTINLSVSCTNSFQTLPPQLKATVSPTISRTYASSTSPTSQSGITSPVIDPTSANLISTLLISQYFTTSGSFDDEQHTQDPASTVTTVTTGLECKVLNYFIFK